MTAALLFAKTETFTAIHRTVVEIFHSEPQTSWRCKETSRGIGIRFRLWGNINVQNHRIAVKVFQSPQKKFSCFSHERAQNAAYGLSGDVFKRCRNLGKQLPF